MLKTLIGSKDKISRKRKNEKSYKTKLALKKSYKIWLVKYYYSHWPIRRKFAITEEVSFSYKKTQ